MARILSQTLIRESQSLIHDPPPTSLSPIFASRFINLRRRSKKAELSELDLGSADDSRSGSEPDVLGIRLLQDAIQAIIVRRAAPDWIPFVPGSSYWIPPMAKKGKDPIMTEEEELSLSTLRGWPSFSYFVEGVLPRVVDNSPDKASHSPGEGSLASENEENRLESADKINDNNPVKARHGQDYKAVLCPKMKKWT